MNYAGLDLDRLASWFAWNVPQAVLPLTYRPLDGGDSNLTYEVADAVGHRFALRRPPLSGLLSTAHDMAREWRAIEALQWTAVPVPPTVGFCGDPTVTGAPFYVTDLVDGFVHHSLEVTLDRSTPEQRTVTGMDLIDVLAELHAVDPAAVGLGTHGGRGGYLERQIRRWHAQYTATRTRDLPDVDRCFERLLDRLPAEDETTVVHGDYRLGNCIVAADGTIAAVVDWEISTLGDPRADLAYLLVTWARPGTDVGELDGADHEPTMAEGFPSAEELVDRYAVRSGRDVSSLDYHIAFNHWRYACITQGVLARYLEGAHGDASADLDGFARAVEQRATLAAQALDAHVTAC